MCLIVGGINLFISLAVIPGVYILLFIPEYLMRNSYRLTVIDEKITKKGSNDEKDEDDPLKLKTDKPFDQNEDSSIGVEVNAKGLTAADIESKTGPQGRLELNPADDYKEVEDEWRIKETFKGTALEGRLPLRAIQLLKVLFGVL